MPLPELTRPQVLALDFSGPPSTAAAADEILDNVAKSPTLVESAVNRFQAAVQRHFLLGAEMVGVVEKKAQNYPRGTTAETMQRDVIAAIDEAHPKVAALVESADMAVFSARARLARFADPLLGIGGEQIPWSVRGEPVPVPLGQPDAVMGYIEGVVETGDLGRLADLRRNPKLPEDARVYLNKVIASLRSAPQRQAAAVGEQLAAFAKMLHPEENRDANADPNYADPIVKSRLLATLGSRAWMFMIKLPEFSKAEIEALATRQKAQELAARADRVLG